jgi:hypothetical protein
MAFDPDSFIAGTQSQAAPELAEPTDKKNKFNPSEFIRKGSDYVPMQEPTMVAETEAQAQSINPDMNLMPQAVSVGARLAEPAYDIAKGVGGVIAGNAKDAYKMGNILYKNVTPGVIGTVISSPITYAKDFASAYVQGHPLMSKLGQTTPQQAVQAGAGYAKNIGGRILAGAVAPESIALMPYQMAAYEQEKIRANPNAPGLQYNPYAQTVRGEATTQNQAGAANQMRTVANMPYGNVNPQERNILEQDRMMRENIRKKAYQRVMGPVAPQ